MLKTFLRNTGLGTLSVALIIGTLGLRAGHADQLEAIKQKGEIVLGTEARFPPFEFVEKGAIVGYTADMLNEIMSSGFPDMKARRLDLPWQGILSGLETKKFDYAMSSMTGTKERAQRYTLSPPIADATMALMKRAGNGDITSPEALNGKIVASQAGTGLLKILQAYQKELAAKNISFEIKEYVDFDGAYSDVAAGRVDAVANSLASLAYTAKLRPDVFEIVPGQFGPQVYFVFAGRKDEDSVAFVQRFNAEISKLKQSGELDKLHQKWFGSPLNVPDKLPEPAI